MFRARVCGAFFFACLMVSARLAGQAVQPAATSSGHEAPTPAGEVTSLKGKASWRPNQSAPEQPLDQGRKLYPGEAVRCLSGCALTIRLYETDVQITEETGWYPIPQVTEPGVPGLKRGGRIAQLQDAPAGISPSHPGGAQAHAAASQATAERARKTPPPPAPPMESQMVAAPMPASTPQPASLPQTGSALPLIGLVGLLSLGAFFTCGLRELRAQFRRSR